MEDVHPLSPAERDGSFVRTIVFAHFHASASPAIFLSAGAFPQHLTAAGCGWNPFGFAAIPLFTHPPHVLYSRREHRTRRTLP